MTLERVLGRYTDGRTSKIREVDVRISDGTVTLYESAAGPNSDPLAQWSHGDIKVCHDWSNKVGGSFEHKDEYGATLALTDKATFDAICKKIKEGDRATYRVAANPVTILALLVLTVGIVVIIFPLMARWTENIAYLVPRSLETKISGIALESIGEEFTECKDDAAHQALEKIVSHLMDAQKNEKGALKKMPEIHLYKTSMVNAFALPGDHMAVLTGFLKDSTSENEVAGVLAHEMGHIYNKDPMKYLVQSQEMRMLAGMMGSSGYSEIASATATLSTLRYSRDKERAADEFAKRILPKGGYTAEGLASFLSRAEKQSPELAQSIQKNLSFLSTHPETAERLRNLEDGTKNKEPVKILTGSEWQALKSACRTSSP